MLTIEYNTHNLFVVSQAIIPEGEQRLDDLLFRFRICWYKAQNPSRMLGAFDWPKLAICPVVDTADYLEPYR